MKNLINCGTCGYPLTPEERATLVEKDGVMVKPAQQCWKCGDMDAAFQAKCGAACGNFSDETIKVVRQTEAAHGIKEKIND